MRRVKLDEFYRSNWMVTVEDVFGHESANLTGEEAARSSSLRFVRSASELGANANVWVRRATLAHELGHLLFDPIQRLDRVRVDTYRSNELDPQSGLNDYVEQRANAFAVAFLAPIGVVREMTSTPIRADSIQNVMSKFGMSYTAARHHVYNSHYRQLPLPPGEASIAPSDEQKAAEDFTLDFFPISKTPFVRRGRFAGVVSLCFERGYLSEDSAAQYVNCSKGEFLDSWRDIRDLYNLT